MTVIVNRFLLRFGIPGKNHTTRLTPEDIGAVVLLCCINAQIWLSVRLILSCLVIDKVYRHDDSVRANNRVELSYCLPTLDSRFTLYYNRYMDKLTVFLWGVLRMILAAWG